MTRKVDPIHFFSERGVSLLTMDHLGKENAKLTRENADLKRRLAHAVQRLKVLQGDPTSPTAN
jgi:hypothetical protein